MYGLNNLIYSIKIDKKKLIIIRVRPESASNRSKTNFNIYRCLNNIFTLIYFLVFSFIIDTPIPR